MANEISITPFKFKYLPMLIELLESNKFEFTSQINMKSLPKTGYIAFYGNQPIAAGFLRRVEGGIAQIDTLTSNPYFGSQIRHEGIRVVVDSLIEDAKDLKLQGIIAFTKDEGVLNRAKSIGFNVVDQTIISLKLDK